MLRMMCRKRKIVEPLLKNHLSAAVHAVDDFFDIKTFDFVKGKSGVSSTINSEAVVCNDLGGFLQYVQEKRAVNESQLKFGIDSGGGSLKICLTVQSRLTDETMEPKSKRRKYTDIAPSNTFRDGGVKKLFVLAIVEGIQENYENVIQLWNTLGINKFVGTIAVDLKLANILCGIMAHSSMFPCTWCYARKDMLNEIGELRTVGNILANYENWCKAGSNIKNAKNFKNCIHPPAVGTDNEQRIIDIVTPPELHLMLGAVNTI